VTWGGQRRSLISGCHVLLADQLPTLWDPEALFAHLALWAGIPAAGVAILTYGCAKSWFEFGASAIRVARSVPEKYRVVQGNVRVQTSVQQRAMARLVFCSVFTIVFSYMLAEIIYVVVQMAEMNPIAPFSLSYMRATAVAVTPWPAPVAAMVVLEVAGIGLLWVALIAELPRLRKLVTFLGGVARAIAWAGTVVLGLFTLGGLASPLSLFKSAEGPSGAVPMAFVVTTAVTAILCLGLALSLTRVRRASEITFKIMPQVAHHPAL
jgi:hypothetical protein